MKPGGDFATTPADREQENLPAGTGVEPKCGRGRGRFRTGTAAHTTRDFFQFLIGEFFFVHWGDLPFGLLFWFGLASQTTGRSLDFERVEKSIGSAVVASLLFEKPLRPSQLEKL
jgi:hypothetical protein